MGILGEAAEAEIRASLEVALPDRCTVRRRGPVADGAGGWTEGMTDVATDVPCRVDRDQRLERETLVAGRTVPESFYVIALSMVASRWPGGVVDVRPSDTLAVTGSGAGVYEPFESGGPSSDEFLREVRATKIG